jgi:8-oxo-dGTP pyrophosphatase MutT (NUDIX family)
MNRTAVLEVLRAHLARPVDANEAEMTADTIRFVEAHGDCFLRSCSTGHLTGSAWVVDPARTQVVLTHHRKLDRWLQLGGHADGDPDLLAVALREAREEAGLAHLRPLGVAPFDVDRHRIPARGTVEEHWHYDLRFLIEAHPAEPLVASDESHAVAWVPLCEVERLNPSESMLRMVRKTSAEVGRPAGAPRMATGWTSEISELSLARSRAVANPPPSFQVP